MSVEITVKDLNPRIMTIFNFLLIPRSWITHLRCPEATYERLLWGTAVSSVLLENSATRVIHLYNVSNNNGLQARCGRKYFVIRDTLCVVHSLDK